MITQMNHQDPLSPQDNTEFVAQLAQFSSVEGLERLNSNFEGFTNTFMSNQALQASSLVGTSVSVETDTSRLMEAGIVSGSVQLESSAAAVRMNIYNDKGALVAQVDRKSTRLNSSHVATSYAGFGLNNKKTTNA